METRSRFEFLDALRGFAAIYVVVYHALRLLWVDADVFAANADAFSVVERGVAFVLPAFAFGRQMVLFFFVLSGFVIHFRYARALQETPKTARFDFARYFWRRARRIYPPFLFALALTFILDQIGIAAGYAPYQREIPLAHDALTLVGNLLFLMTVYVPVWGTDDPLWSLMLEWWFYMLYPLFWRIGKWSMLGATGILIVLFVISVSTPLVWYLGIFQIVFASMLSWWMGALVADIYVGRLQFPLRKLGLLALLVVPLMPSGLIPLRGGQYALHDVAWSIAFMGVIAALLAWDRRGGSLRWMTWFSRTADFSYTLYVIHMPLLTLLAGWVLANVSGGVKPTSVWWVVIGTGLCVLVAWAAHFVVEKPFMRAPKRQPVLSGDHPTRH